MPASAPKGWFKRWAFGFGLAGWILLGVLALTLIACWRGWDPIYGFEWIAIECFGSRTMFHVVLAYTYLWIAFECGFSIPAAALMIAAAATSGRRLNRWAVWITLLSGAAWGLRHYAGWALSDIGWKASGSTLAGFFGAVERYPGVVLLAVCGGWICHSWTIAIALAVLGLGGVFGYDALINAWVLPGGFLPPGWEVAEWSAITAWHLCVLVPILIWAAHIRRMPIVPLPCPSCGYDLTGLNNSKCPECGAESRPTSSS